MPEKGRYWDPSPVPTAAAPAGGDGGVLVDAPKPPVTPNPRPNCNDERMAWGRAYRGLRNLEARDTVGKALEALVEANAERDSARRDLAQRTSAGTYPAAVRTDAEKAQYDAGRQTAQTRLDEAEHQVTEAQTGLAEARRELADARANEQATAAALDDCEKRAAAGG